jgi:hypothetical protein
MTTYAEDAPLIAWRSWTLTTSYGQTRIAGSDDETLWSTPAQGHFEAWCECPADERSTCGCGVLAARTQETAIEDAIYNGEEVIGEVALWGEVYESDTGYVNAQYARVVSLKVSEDTEHADAIRRTLHELYEVPVGAWQTPAETDDASSDQPGFYVGPFTQGVIGLGALLGILAGLVILAQHVSST